MYIVHVTTKIGQCFAHPLLWLSKYHMLRLVNRNCVFSKWNNESEIQL